MNKKLIAVLILVTMALPLTACGAENSVVRDADTAAESTAMFERHTFDDGSGYSILVDKETGVCYLEYDGIRQYGLTIILNADGTPKIWEEN